MTRLTIVKAIQTCAGCPAQWDAWTDTGQYLYLRFRWGQGSAEAYPDPDTDTWDIDADALVAAFTTDNEWAGDITLTEFCERAGLVLAEGAEIR